MTEGLATQYGLCTTQLGRYVNNTGNRPQFISKKELSGVCMRNVRRKLCDNITWNKARFIQGEVLAKEYTCQEVEVVAIEITDGAQFTRRIVGG